MVQDNYELETIKEFKKVLKPKLFWPIWNTIICSGPPLNLIFSYFLERDIKKPTAAIILTVIAIVWITINWYWYVKARNDFKKNWQKISVELETLNFKEKPSKNYIETIFNGLQITAIVSLVAFFTFVAIELFSKLSYFKYFALFSISIFLLTAIGIIIVSIILFVSFIKDVKKEGRLKNLLKRVFLIFTFLFIIQMIYILIMHKNPDWFVCLLYSLIMTLPVIISTEVAIIYKEIKKEYPMIDSPDESDIK
jgi:vacuolar-type H+-ATPase subunit I/STV1